MEVGQRVRGIVTRVFEGAFLLEADGMLGTVQITEVIWIADGLDRLKVLARVGQPIDVLVIAVDRRSARFSASIKQLHPEQNPWRDPTRFHAGPVHEGRVATILEWGTVVTVAGGAEGVILHEHHPVRWALGDSIVVIVEECLVRPELELHRVTLSPVTVHCDANKE